MKLYTNNLSQLRIKPGRDVPARLRHNIAPNQHFVRGHRRGEAAPTSGEMKMTQLRRSGLALALVLACLGLPGAARADEARVTGEIAYRERIALPPGYVLRVEILDISRQDVAATTVSATELRPDHQVPVAYALAFDPARIDPAHRYAVRAEILVDGRLDFTTTQVHPVITGGAPLKADLILSRVAQKNRPAPEIVGEWLVEDIGGRGVIDSLRSTLRIDADGNLSGLAGCNRFAGAISYPDGTFRLGPLASTMMACPDAAADQESRYHAALEAVRSAGVEGAFLILRDGDGKPLVRLTRVRKD